MVGRHPCLVQVTIVAGALILSGCGLQVRPTVEAFEDQVSAIAPSWRDYMSNDDALRIALDFCDHLGRSQVGTSVDQVAAANKGIRQEYVAAAALAGLATYCPEHTEDVRAFTESQR